MNRMLIFDRDHEGNVLHVRCLWDVLLAVRPDLLSNLWEVRSSYGYGEKVCELEDMLRNEPVSLSSAELATAFEESIFYDGVFRGTPSGVEFGVKDSTYLFVESHDQRLDAAVKEAFADVRGQSLPAKLT